MHESSPNLWQNWASFAQYAWHKESEKVELLRSLVQLALGWCARSDTTESIQQLQEALEDNHTFFKQPQMELVGSLLDSEWANRHMEAVLVGDPDEEGFIWLLVAYGQVVIEKLVSHFDSDAAVRFMGEFHPRYRVC